jgi:hypothetical protein
MSQRTQSVSMTKMWWSERLPTFRRILLPSSFRTAWPRRLRPYVPSKRRKRLATRNSVVSLTTWFLSNIALRSLATCLQLCQYKNSRSLVMPALRTGAVFAQCPLCCYFEVPVTRNLRCCDLAASSNYCPVTSVRHKEGKRKVLQ